MEQHFRRNTLGISAVELLWGLGTPVVFESTFLQLFVRNLGASSFLIGLIPTLLSVGIALFAPVSATLTAHLQRKRPAVIILHVLASLPLLFFGILLSIRGFTASTLFVFFCAYGFYSFGIGLIFPVWQNYLVKIFTEQRAISALAVMWTTQSVAKVVSSFVILRIVERYSFSAAGVSIIFTGVGVLFLVGSFLFLITREEPQGPDQAASPPGRSIIQSFGRVLRNRNFMIFLGTELDFFALVGILSFYAIYATEHCGIDLALASGLFVAFNYFGGVTVNIVLGWFRLLSLKNKYWLTKTLSIASVSLICIFCRPWAFLLASYFFGASRSTRMLVFPPAVKRLSGLSDATHYYALAPLLTLPLSAGIPLINGAALDGLSSLGGWSYRIVFLAMASLMAFSLLFLARIDAQALQPADLPMPRPGPDALPGA